jgi:serine/threonine-protein kinase RsbW
MSQKEKKQLSFELKNDLSELASLTRHLEGFAASAGLSREVLFRLNLALEEVFTNIVSYGYADDAVHTVYFTLSQEDSVMTFRITDDGTPFDPLSVAPPDTVCPLNERQTGGMGLTLIRHCMDHIEYRRHGDRNVLIMTKTI